MGCLYPTVAYDTEIIHMYLARDLSFGDRHLDQDEFIDVIKLPFDEALAGVFEGRYPDAKTQLAILKAAKLLGK